MQSEGQTLSKLHQFGTSTTVKNLPGTYTLTKRYIFLSAYKYALRISSDIIIIVQVRKPSTSKYISIQDKHGKVVDRINVLSDDVQILGKKLTFSTNFHWNDSKDYVMVFEQGVYILIFTPVCIMYRESSYRSCHWKQFMSYGISAQD